MTTLKLELCHWLKSTGLSVSTRATLMLLFLESSTSNLKRRTVENASKKSTVNYQQKSIQSNFRMPVELLAEASSKKNFYIRFHWWQTVLLECDSNLANSCCVIERRLSFRKRENDFFANFHFFPVTVLPVVGKTNYIDTNNNSPKYFNRLLIRKTNFRFPMCFLRFVIFIDCEKNRCPHLRTKFLTRIRHVFTPPLLCKTKFLC